MIRPIDTQILYPQAPTLSNRQQVDNQKPMQHQENFAQIMKQETEQKKETVIETEKDSGVKFKKENEKKEGQSKKDKKQSSQEQKKEPNQLNGQYTHSESTIDIRI
ncbi:MAG: hypothetical protein ACRCWY_03735 [Cellulosilyticaceae bacterium]